MDERRRQERLTADPTEADHTYLRCRLGGEAAAGLPHVLAAKPLEDQQVRPGSLLTPDDALGRRLPLDGFCAGDSRSVRQLARGNSE